MATVMATFRDRIPATIGITSLPPDLGTRLERDVLMGVLQQPEAYLGGAGKFFDDSGKLDAGIEGFLQKFIDAYAAWVERHLGR